MVTLSSSATANATISPASLTIAAGQTVGNFTYTGVAAGNSTLSASASNYLTGTAMVTGTSAQVSLGAIPPVAPGQTVSLALSLPTAAPPGGTTVTFVSSNTNVATVTGTIFVPAGQRTAATNPQVTGIIIGTTTIGRQRPRLRSRYAAGHGHGHRELQSDHNLPQPHHLHQHGPQYLRAGAGGGIKFTLSSDAPTIATVPASVTVVQGATQRRRAHHRRRQRVHHHSRRLAQHHRGPPTLSPSTARSPSARSPPAPVFSQNSYISLPVSPSAPITVTVTSSNPAIATLSTNPNTGRDRRP